MALVVDDILFFPAKSLLFIFKEIHKAALEELAQQAENTRAELSQLYLRFEGGEIVPDDFDRLEAELLDRLDELEGLTLDDDDEDDDEADDAREAEPMGDQSS